MFDQCAEAFRGESLESQKSRVPGLQSEALVGFQCVQDRTEQKRGHIVFGCGYEQGDDLELCEKRAHRNIRPIHRQRHVVATDLGRKDSDCGSAELSDIYLQLGGDFQCILKVEINSE